MHPRWSSFPKSNKRINSFELMCITKNIKEIINITIKLLRKYKNECIYLSTYLPDLKVFSLIGIEFKIRSKNK